LVLGNSVYFILFYVYPLVVENVESGKNTGVKATRHA